MTLKEKVKEYRKTLSDSKYQRYRKQAKTGQAAMLYALLHHFGGPTQIAKLLTKGLREEFPRQTFVNWVRRGKVPLKKVYLVSDVLKVSPFSLNYAEVCEMKGEQPSWKSVVNNTPVAAHVKKEVLARPEPQ